MPYSACLWLVGMSIVRSIRNTLSLSIALVALAKGSPSWARLGETEEQCEKRYGKASLPENLIGNFGWDAKRRQGAAICEGRHDDLSGCGR